MVQAKLAEFASHRSHQQAFLAAFPPSVFTRVLMVLLQGFSLVMSFFAFLVYPPLLLSIDRWMNAFATQVGSNRAPPPMTLSNPHVHRTRTHRCTRMPSWPPRRATKCGS